jgi:ferritin-like metal-binding protein YciE
MMEQKQDLIRSYCNDVVELQRHIIRMTEDQAKEEDLQRYSQVHEVVAKVRDTVGRHASEMEQHLSALGGESSSMLQQAASMVTGMATGLITRGEGSENAAKVLRNNYVALEMVSVGYLLLYTTAQALQDHATADIVNRHLSDTRPIATRIKDLIPETVVQELSNEGYQVDTSAAREIP